MKPTASLSETSDASSGDGSLSPAFIQSRVAPRAAAGFPCSPVAAYLITRFDRAEFRVPLQYIPLEAA